MHITDELRDALGAVLAEQRREWKREFEVSAALSRAENAEFRAANLALRAENTALRDEAAAALARHDHLVTERLAGLRDGRDGVDGTPGRNAEPVTEAQIAEAVARYLEANPPQAGRDGVDGRDGERGDPGPAGALPVVRAWQDAVHYAGEVVAYAGGTYQAARDTGREPPHDDWTCLAAPGLDGADGRTPRIRGTWADDAAYAALDVVMLNGASFVARVDSPGPCPGEGWQLWAAQGKRGQAGENGRKGERGDPGPPGPAVVEMAFDDEGLLTGRNADGTTFAADAYPLLSRIAER